jgi:uncharacterized protein (DUF488 family)
MVHRKKDKAGCFERARFYMKNITTLYSIGYQGKSISDFCRLLVENKVKVLVDVRERAWSQRPQYRKNALRESLLKSGIEYIHCKEAGNPFRPHKDEKLDFDLCAKQYQAYLNSKPDVINYLEDFSEKHASAVFCYEAERKNCHRGILIKRLVEKNPQIQCIDI